MVFWVNYKRFTEVLLYKLLSEHNTFFSILFYLEQEQRNQKFQHEEFVSLCLLPLYSGTMEGHNVK